MKTAEFGRGGSGAINLIYKSGTNQYHGGAFRILRNSGLESNSFFSNLNQAALANEKQNVPRRAGPPCVRNR